MGNGPAPFAEIGRRAKDLLTKDYNYDQKFTFSLLGNSPLVVTASGVKIDQFFVGDINSQYRSGRTTFDVKVDSNSNVSTTVTVNEIVSGVKTSFSFKLPDQKSGKVDVQYIHDNVAVNSSIGLTPNPLLEFSAVLGNKEISFGGEVGFDSTSASFTKYNAGIGYNKDDFSAAVILADKGNTLKASYVHEIDSVTGATVAAELVHRLTTYENTFSIGSSYKVDPLTLVKARFSDDGRVAALFQREWRPKSLITLSAEYNAGAIENPTRVGLALALKH